MAARERERITRALGAARDEARPFLAGARRDPAFASLRAWLEGPEPAACLACEDARLRMGLSFALATQARRMGFEVVLVPLGPDLWRDRDVFTLLGRKLSIQLAITPARYRLRRLAKALSTRSPARPWLLVIDGLEDSDPDLPWRMLAAKAGPAARVLFAGSDRAEILARVAPQRPLIEAGAMKRGGPWPPARPAGAGGTLLDLLAYSVGALSRDELRRALRGAPRLDSCAAWAIEEGGGHRLRRALRGLAQVRAADRRRWDARLAALPTRYGLAFGAVHTLRAGASPRAMIALLAPERLEGLREEGSAEQGFAFDAERVRAHAVARLARGAADMLAIAVRAALTEATAATLCTWSPRRRPTARLDDGRKLALSLIALADAARGDARAQLLRMAREVALRIEAPAEHDDVLSALAARARGRARERLARPDQVTEALPVAVERATEVGDEGPLGLLLPRLEREAVDALCARKGLFSLDLRRALARRLVELGGNVEAALDLARDEGERRLILADTLPLAPDAKQRATGVAREIATLPDPDRQDALATLGTPLARLGLGLALVPYATSRLPALALALGDRRCARALAHALAEWTLADDEGYLLLRIGPMARAFSFADLHRLVACALEWIAADLRGAALAGDGVSLAAVAPLLAPVAGSAGLLAVGQAAVAVARAFP